MEIKLDLNFIRYINLLERISKVRAKNCFLYNGTIVFVVGKSQVYKAIGKNGENMKIINSTFKKRVKVISEAKNKKEIIEFIKNLISPIKVEEIRVNNEELTIKAGLEERSILIGRERKGEKELLNVLDSLFEIKKINFIK